jgi:Tol biopolymer transport system component
MRRDGTHVHHVTDTDDVEEFGPFQAGKRIAFEQEIGDDGQIWSVKSDGETNVYSMDPAGMTEVPLTENLESDGDSSFSPRSKRITFESRRDGTDAEIVTMKANGDGEEQLTENSDFDGDPAYSPSGKKIVFVGTDGSEYQLYSIRASDGKKRHQITHYK